MRYIFIIIVALGLIAFNYKKSFNESAAEHLGIEIDSRAVSVLSGTITHVRDGDTFEVNETPVRISALDCPENSTSSGQKATRLAKQFIGKQAVCELTGAKTYDRVVGYCSIEGKDFAQLMVENKLCKFWPKYDVWNRY
jgi:endonuclease YncB( thermonuclease family)